MDVRTRVSVLVIGLAKEHELGHHWLIKTFSQSFFSSTIMVVSILLSIQVKQPNHVICMNSYNRAVVLELIQL